MLSVLEVKATELMKSRSSSVVMIVLVVVMLFMIPVIVYVLSESSSTGSGNRLLEGASKGRTEAGPSHPGSSRQLRTPGVAGSQRLSVESQVQAVLPPTAQHHSPSDGPPVICRELVLPETEARFLIEAASLRSEGAQTRTVTILGGSGRQPLLVAYLQDHGPKGFQLWLHSMGQNSTVLETPRAVVVPGRSMSNFEIYDRDLKLYGELESTHPGRLTLKCNSFPVLVIDETSDELHYNACQMDGRMLATGRLAPDVPPHVLTKLGGEAWRLRVVAGCDAIVVLSTMLTAMLMKRFRPGNVTSSMPPSSKPSMVLG
mmetsp:Transcript_86212/g.136952  ORF Transcript_86212/g.136952 Transcript_86212/m.136952 type:complete len:316 (-) Transcript_86212:74-1021(-)